MKIDKETLIAAVMIFFLLIGTAIAFNFYVTETGVYLRDEIHVHITPYTPIQTRSGKEAEIIPTEQDILPGVLGVGYHVRINNTGGDGLRIRSAPGMESQTLYLGAEGEKYVIIGGPSLVDSRIWWQIESLQDENRSGWAVQDYLSSID